MEFSSWREPDECSSLESEVQKAGGVTATLREGLEVNRASICEYVCARSCSTPRNESASKSFLFTQTFRLERSDRWQVQKYTWRQNWSLMLLLTFYLRIKSKKCLSHLKYLGGRNKEQQQNFLSFEWGDQINLDDPGKSCSIKTHKKRLWLLYSALPLKISAFEHKLPEAWVSYCSGSAKQRLAEQQFKTSATLKLSAPLLIR